MLNSKEIKDTDPESLEKNRKSDLYYWWIETKLCKIWNKFIRFFQNKYYAIEKLYGWQKNVFCNDYDFDAHCLYGIIQYKLTRVLYSLENGHAYQEDKDMKALKLAIKLAGRLKEDEYNRVQLDRHNLVWGELVMKTDRVASWDSKGKPASYCCDMSRPGAVTPEQIEQERTEFALAYERSEVMKQRDLKNFYGILAKYLRVWWD